MRKTAKLAGETITSAYTINRVRKLQKCINKLNIVLPMNHTVLRKDAHIATQTYFCIQAQVLPCVPGSAAFTAPIEAELKEETQRLKEAHQYVFKEQPEFESEIFLQQHQLLVQFHASEDHTDNV